MKKALLTVGVLAAIGLILFASLRGRGEDAAEVDVEPVERRDISRVVKASGTIDPRIKVNLSAHVVGKIETLHVEEGDTIEAGAPFLDLEREAFVAQRQDWQARLRQAETDVRRRQAELADARLKAERASRLAGEGIVSDEALEAAELAVTSARLALEQARQAVEQARANLVKAADDLRKTTIYAPIGGRVIDLNAEQGEVVVSGTMNNPASIIGVIADLSELLAELDVDETEIVFVEVGQPATITLDALPDREWSGRVVEVGSSGYERPSQPDVTFFAVEVLLDDPDPVLRPGMSVRARIETATEVSVPVVPIQAVVEREAGSLEDGTAANPDRAASGEADEEVQVVFVEEGGVARARRVTTGLADETHVQIVDGVEPGERVIVGPYRELRDLEAGDAVSVEDGGERKKRGRGSEDDENEDT